MPDNGHTDQEAPAQLDHLLLTFDRRTLTLEFSGDAWDRIARHEPRAFDLLLGMLTQGLRHVETQFRIIAGLEAQKQVQAQQEEAARIARLMGR